MGITKTEILFAWVKFLFIEFSRLALSFFCFPLVPGILFVVYGHWIFLLLALSIPISLVLKYGFGVKNLWLLNDTEDGDFGDPKLLEKYGHTGKWKIFKFIWWWIRNHSWNYIRKFKPDWNGGETVDFKVIKNTTGIDPKYQKWIWCERDGVHGINYVAYRVYEGGKVFFRYSRASPNKERKYGAGGSGYKFHRKPAF